MRRWIAWLGMILSASCGPHPAPGVPVTGDAFTYWLLSHGGDQRNPTTCVAPMLDLGSTRMVQPRDRQVQFPLPLSYHQERWNLPQDRVFFPAIGWQLGQEWMPGIHLIAAWDRWTSVQVPGGPADVLFQVMNRQGYQPFVAAAPWKLAVSAECILALSDRPIRVLRFELHHPTAPSQWGLAASWRGRPGDSDLSVLAIGPDPGIQAEALQILRTQVP